jgi:hypothetical protein
VAPIDGQEYATHSRGETTKHADAKNPDTKRADTKNADTKHVDSDLKKRKHVATRDDHGRAKRTKIARASKVGKVRSARDTPSRTRLHG